MIPSISRRFYHRSPVTAFQRAFWGPRARGAGCPQRVSPRTPPPRAEPRAGGGLPLRPPPPSSSSCGCGRGPSSMGPSRCRRRCGRSAPARRRPLGPLLRAMLVFVRFPCITCPPGPTTTPELRPPPPVVSSRSGGVGTCGISLA